MGKRTNTAVWDGKRWKINVQKDGVRKSFYSGKAGRTGQREANAKADAWLDDGVEASKLRVSNAYLEFLEHKKGSISAMYFSVMQSHWNNNIEPVIGKMRIETLQEPDLQKVINSAYKQKGLAAKTLLEIKGELAAFCKYCRMRKYTQLYPENLTVPRQAERPQKAILQPQHISTLFSSSTTTYRGRAVTDALIHAYRIAVLTGMRPGEIIGLEWSDIQDGKILIRRSVNVAGEITQGKNQNAQRIIQLPQTAITELEQQRNETGKNQRVFPITCEQTFYKRWKAYCDHNGIPRVTLYELRHTFVSVAQALPEGMVKKLVGHSKSMDTWGTYAHLIDGQQETAAALIEQAFTDILN